MRGRRERVSVSMREKYGVNEKRERSEEKECV